MVSGLLIKRFYRIIIGIFIGTFVTYITVSFLKTFGVCSYFIQKDTDDRSHYNHKLLHKLPYQFDYPVNSPWIPEYAHMPIPLCRSFGEWLRNECSRNSNNNYSDYTLSDLFGLIHNHRDYLKLETQYLINCGANDGRTIDPLYPIFMEYKYPGIAIELQEGLYAQLKMNLPANNIVKLNQALEPHTVEQLFKENRVPHKPLLLKMDIDGYDYPIVRTLFIHRSNSCRTNFEPALVMVEMNEKIPPPINFYTRYRVPYAYKNDHLYGASITAWTHLLSHELGYVLLGTYDWNNLIYIRYDLAKKLKLLYKFPHNSHDVWSHGYWSRSEREKRFPWNKNVLHWNDPNTSLLVKYRAIENYFHSARTFIENVNCSYHLDLEPIYIEPQ